jgi:protein SCO1/2
MVISTHHPEIRRPVSSLGALRTAAAAGLMLMLASAVLADVVTDEQPPPEAPGGITTATGQYQVPDVRVLRDDGHSVSLTQEMNDGRPVVLNFIFTSCSSVCPLLSQTLGQFQRQLGAERDKVHIMSISIDPEEDTPARLREYARKFHAGPGWQHYTGTLQASLTAQRAFDVYRGDKMSHTAVTLLRAAPGQPWRRIEGLLTPEELLAEYRALVGASGKSVASR